MDGNRASLLRGLPVGQKRSLSVLPTPETVTGPVRTQNSGLPLHIVLWLLYLTAYENQMLRYIAYLLLILLVIAGFGALGYAFADNFLVVVAGGLGCVGGIACLLILVGRETGAVNRNRMAARRRGAEFRSCNVCGEPFGDGEDGTAYHIMQKNKHMGTVSLHHGPDCMASGLDLLAEQAADAGAPYVRAVHRLGSRTFMYDATVKSDFGFEVENGNRANRWTLEFLRQFSDYRDLIFVRFAGPKAKMAGQRCHDIPILLLTEAAVVQDAVCRDLGYAARVRHNQMKMRRSLAVCRDGVQQCKIMARYAMAAMLTARTVPDSRVHAVSGRRG